MYEAELKDGGGDTSIIPVPSGWKILIATPKMKERTEGGVLLTEGALEREALASVIGNVVSMGADCYQDKARYPNGPWCAVGDWVLFRSYAGTRFKIKEQEFRLVNEDTIEAVVPDPREIKRA